MAQIPFEQFLAQIMPDVLRAPPVPMPTPTGPSTTPIRRDPMDPINTTPAFNPWDERMQEEWFANLAMNNPMSPQEGFGYPNPTIGSRMLDRSTTNTYGENSPLAQFIAMLSRPASPSIMTHPNSVGGMQEMNQPQGTSPLPTGPGTVARNPVTDILAAMMPEFRRGSR